MELDLFLEKMRQCATVREGSECHTVMHKYSNEAMRITAELNGAYHSPGEVRALLSKLIGKPVEESVTLFPPFTSDFGKNLTLGKNVFINAGCRFQDQGGIVIEDGVFIGHNVVLATLNHDIHPDRRGSLLPAPIHIGKRVWIGANATVLPGVTVGAGAILGAGAVVTKDIPPNTVAVGVPARVMKTIVSGKSGEERYEIPK